MTQVLENFNEPEVPQERNIRPAGGLTIPFRIRCIAVPGRVDPDDIQVAEVDALHVEPVVAGAAFSPDPVRSRMAVDLMLSGDRKTRACGEDVHEQNL